MEEVSSRRDQVRDYVARKLYALEQTQAEPAVRAALAKMRRGVGKKPGDDPALWGMLFDDLPEQLEGRGAAPTREEWAIYTALTLYALHQQGHKRDSENMNASDQSLGAAVARLTEHDEGAVDAVRRRFNAMATSSDMEELVWHLRGIVTLLRRSAIPLDYPMLATELFRFQTENGKAAVRLAWGRTYYAAYNRQKKTDESGKDDTNE